MRAIVTAVLCIALAAMAGGCGGAPPAAAPGVGQGQGRAQAQGQGQGQGQGQVRAPTGSGDAVRGGAELGGAAPRATEAPQPAPPGAAVESRLMAALQPLSPQQALAKKDNWGIPGAAVACTGAATDNPEETILACQWGLGYNAMFDGHILVWRSGGQWKSQPYPPEGLRGIGYFQRIYRQGDRLIVIMNVARAMTYGTEQVQVLRWAGRWEMAWLPEESAWTRGHATVRFGPVTYDRFTVETDSYLLPDEERGPFGESNAGDHRPFLEEWVKDPQGPGYVRVSRAEIPSAYGAVVHFVSALAKGNDQEAERWASGPEVVRQAKAAGLPASAAKGYFTRHEDGTADGHSLNRSVFRLYTIATENPQWAVKVRKQDDNWVVYDVR